MFPRKEIKANARAALSAHYWPVVGILFLGAFLASILCLIGVVPMYVSMFRAAMRGMYGYPAFYVVVQKLTEFCGGTKTTK